MFGLKFDTGYIDAIEVSKAALREGLFIPTFRHDTIRLMPPLDSTKEELKQISDRMDQAIDNIWGKHHAGRNQ